MGIVIGWLDTVLHRRRQTATGLKDAVEGQTDRLFKGGSNIVLVGLTGLMILFIATSIVMFVSNANKSQ